MAQKVSEVEGGKRDYAQFLDYLNSITGGAHVLVSRDLGEYYHLKVLYAFKAPPPKFHRHDTDRERLDLSTHAEGNAEMQVEF